MYGAGSVTQTHVPVVDQLVLVIRSARYRFILRVETLERGIIYSMREVAVKYLFFIDCILDVL